MPTIDNWRALRDALETWPDDEPWVFGSFAGGRIHIGTKSGLKHDPLAFMSGAGSIPWDATAESREAYNAADYIAAAHPAAIRSLLDERDRLAEDYGRACKLVADMHAAAVGEFGRGPQRGVIEDVADLKAERDRLAAEQHVMRQWIADVLPWIQGQQSLYPNHELGALCESGRRLVDGGPDDLLAGVE